MILVKISSLSGRGGGASITLGDLKRDEDFCEEEYLRAIKKSLLNSRERWFFEYTFLTFHKK